MPSLLICFSPGHYEPLWGFVIQATYTNCLASAFMRGKDRSGDMNASSSGSWWVFEEMLTVVARGRLADFRTSGSVCRAVAFTLRMKREKVWWLMSPFNVNNESQNAKAGR